MTIVEVIAVILAIAFLAELYFLTTARRRGHRVACSNNLKQVGLAYIVWAGDNNGQYPWEVSETNYGTREWMSGPEAWRTYQVMSNELSTPKILACPQDTARWPGATNFGDDLKNKISYFAGLDARDKLPQSWLSGDDNFVIGGIPVKPGLLNITSNTPIGWDAARHVADNTHFWTPLEKRGAGFVLMGDGSVLGLENASLNDCLRQTGLATNRLAIP